MRKTEYEKLLLHYLEKLIIFMKLLIKISLYQEVYNIFNEVSIKIRKLWTSKQLSSPNFIYIINLLIEVLPRMNNHISMRSLTYIFFKIIFFPSKKVLLDWVCYISGLKEMWEWYLPRANNLNGFYANFYFSMP